MAENQTGFSITVNGPSMFVLRGELDMTGESMFEAAIADAVLCGGPIFLEMTELTFMDSTGLRALLSTAEMLSPGCLVLHGVNGAPQRLLEVTGVRQVPGIHVIPCEELSVNSTEAGEQPLEADLTS